MSSFDVLQFVCGIKLLVNLRANINLLIIMLLKIQIKHLNKEHNYYSYIIYIHIMYIIC